MREQGAKGGLGCLLGGLVQERCSVWSCVVKKHTPKPPVDLQLQASVCKDSANMLAHARGVLVCAGQMQQRLHSCW